MIAPKSLSVVLVQPFVAVIVLSWRRELLGAFANQLVLLVCLSRLELDRLLLLLQDLAIGQDLGTCVLEQHSDLIPQVGDSWE
jgi:hypothetical protein